MLLATNAQGSGFLLNTQQHCFQGKGEREELVQLQCLEKCSQVCNFLNSFVQDCSCSLPQWWAVKWTFFTPCECFFLLLVRPLSLPMLFIAVIVYAWVYFSTYFQICYDSLQLTEGKLNYYLLFAEPGCCEKQKWKKLQGILYRPINITMLRNYILSLISIK